MSVEKTRFCAVDIETTGLDIKSDQIISFACVPMAGTRILVGEAFYTLIRPPSYKVASMKYHGISERDLDQAPVFEEVADKILDAANGILVGHSVGFDYDFLRKAFKATKRNFKREVLDIVCIERWLGRKSGRVGEDLTFEAVMHRYGLKESYRHNALADAFFAAQIFQLELHGLMEKGVHSLKELKRAACSYKYAVW
jgi:DNA polymerase-3 subunit epsilon